MRKVPTFNWTGLPCALVLTAALSPLLAQQPATPPLPLPALENQQRMVFQGVVRPAQIGAVLPNGTATGVNVPASCEFEMLLKPGQNKIEARLVGAIRQKSPKNCEADFDVGIPTILDHTPASPQAAVLPATDAANAVVSHMPPTETFVPGMTNGNLPDFSEIFGARREPRSGGPEHAGGVIPRFAPNGSPQFSSGYVNGIVTDPVGIQVTYINLYTGWVWTGPGVCVTNGSYSRYVTDYWPTSWYVAYDSPTQYTNCNGSVNYTYTQFNNPLFCVAATGNPFAGTTYVYYWPLQVQGWQDGSLYGNFAWQLGGSICSYLLTPRFQLARSVN
jgi:hypothetical protein